MSKYIWCVDLGGTKVQSALIDSNKEITDYKIESVNLSDGPQGLINQLHKLYLGHGIILGHNTKLAMGVIASAGPLNSNTGELLNPTNLKTNNKSWGRFNLIEELNKKIPDLHLKLENDAAAAADGEYWLASKKDNNYKSFLMLTLGTGLGVAAYIHGKRVKGRGGLHPETSHQLSHKEGKTYEQLLSATQWKKTLKKAYNNEELALALKEKDQDIIKNLEVYIEDLVKIIRNFYLVYTPSQVILAGGFAEFLKPVLPEINKRLVDSTKDHHYLISPPEVIVSENYRYNGLYGAGYLGFQKNKETQ